MKKTKGVPFYETPCILESVSYVSVSVSVKMATVTFVLGDKARTPATVRQLLAELPAGRLPCRCTVDDRP